MSSAYIINLKRSLESAMSLIYIINRSGPKIDPWGTPVVIATSSDLKWLNTTTELIYNDFLKTKICGDISKSENEWLNNTSSSCVFSVISQLFFIVPFILFILTYCSRKSFHSEFSLV